MIHWTDNTGVCGALEFEVWEDREEWYWNCYVKIKVDASTYSHIPLINTDYYPNSKYSEADARAAARAAAEEVAKAVYAGETVWKYQDEYGVPQYTEFKRPDGQQQRGAWIPLAGE